MDKMMKLQPHSHPCKGDIESFDRKLLKRTISNVSDKLMLSELNNHLSSIRTHVDSIRFVTAQSSNNYTAGRRWGAWSLNYIKNRQQDRQRKTGHIAEESLKEFNSKLISLDLNLWHDKNKISWTKIPNSPRRSTKEEYIKRKKMAAATMMQSCYLGYKSRTLPTFIEGKNQIILGKKVLDLDYGVLCVRFGRKKLEDLEFSRMQQYVIRYREKSYLELYGPDDSGMEELPIGIVHFPSDLSQLSFEAKPFKKSEGKNNQPGILLHDINLEELSDNDEEKIEYQYMWIYAPTRRRNEGIISEMLSFIQSVVLKTQLRNARRNEILNKAKNCEAMLKAKNVKWYVDDSKLIHPKPCEVFEKEREAGRLRAITSRTTLDIIQLVGSTLETFTRMASRSTAVSRMTSKTISEMDSKSSGVSLDAENKQVKTLVDTLIAKVIFSYKRAFASGSRNIESNASNPKGPNLRLLTLSDSYFLKAKWMASKHAGYVGLLTPSKIALEKVNREIQEMHSECSSVIGRAYRSTRALRWIRSEVRLVRDRRTRFLQSLRKHNAEYEIRWAELCRYRNALMRYSASLIQRIYRKYVDRCGEMDIAASCIQRLGLRFIARLEILRLLKIKHEQDEKVKISLFKMKNRRTISSMERWKEYKTLHKIWRGRYDKFHGKMCAKLIQKNFRNLVIRYKNELMKSVLSPSILHPRLHELLVDFFRLCDFQNFIEQRFNDYMEQVSKDYSNHVDIPISGLSRMKTEASLSLKTKYYSNRKRKKRWNVGIPTQSKVSLRKLELVLFPYFEYPCIKLIDQKQYILLQFWKVISALNIDLWRYTRDKREYECVDMQSQEEKMISTLFHEKWRGCRRQEQENSVQDSVCKKSFNHIRLAPLSSKEEVIKWRDLSVLCLNCLALFTKKSVRRCMKCNIPRYLEESRDGGCDLSNQSTNFELDQFLVHASFVTKIEELVEEKFKANPTAEKLFVTARDIRHSLDIEEAWWAAVCNIRQSIILFKESGILTLQDIVFAKVNSHIVSFEDWKVPSRVAYRLNLWISIVGAKLS